MTNNTLLNALTTYRTQMQSAYETHTHAEIEQILNQIDSCEKYLAENNMLTTGWLKGNYQVLSKAVKCAHDFANRNRDEFCSGDMREELRDLNNLLRFFTDYLRQLNIDIEYMSI